MTSHATAVVTAAVRGEVLVAAPGTIDSLAFELIRGRDRAALAVAMDVSVKSLGRWATPANFAGEEHRDLPAKHIVPLCRAAGSLRLVEWIADQVGCVLVRRTLPVAPRPLSVLARLGAMTAEFGDVQRATAAALEDEAMTPTEATAIDEQLTELVREAESLRLAVATGTRKPGTKAVGR